MEASRYSLLPLGPGESPHPPWSPLINQKSHTSLRFPGKIKIPHTEKHLEHLSPSTVLTREEDTVAFSPLVPNAHHETAYQMFCLNYLLSD